MDLTNMSLQERYDMMQRRHAFLHKVAEQYNSLSVFMKEKEEWFAILGIELTLHEKYISLYISLGFNDYETYYIIPGTNGRLDVSEVIDWQDPYFANDTINIFTKESVEDEYILNSIHDFTQQRTAL